MKYTTIIIFIALATTTLLAQQEEKPLNHNLIIGIGIGDFPKVHFLDNNIEERRSLPLSYGLEYRLDYKRFNFKASSYYKQVFINGYSPRQWLSSVPYAYTLDRKRCNVFVGFSYKWLKKENIEIYSGLELGAFYFHQAQVTYNVNDDKIAASSERGFMITGNFNYIGCRYFMGKHLYGITELGLGDKGIIHTGIGFRF